MWNIWGQKCKLPGLEAAIWTVIFRIALGRTATGSHNHSRKSLTISHPISHCRDQAGESCENHGRRRIPIE